VAPDVPDVVRADSTRIRQIILNLAGNSIKFTHQGEIVVSVHMDPLEAGDPVFHFKVADTGIGIPPEKQKAIFEPFSQADSSVSRKYGGTGLGLTISTRLVGIMGGKIWVESDVGRGSVFHFTLPLAIGGTLPVQTCSAVTMELLRDAKALIVDDNHTNCRILEAMLRRWEMKTCPVESAEEALLELSAAQAAGTPYDLVLTDLRMPKMDGFALIERIRQRPELSAATIIMLTSAGHRGDAARCQKLHVSAYLLKPIRQTELREAIARVLGAREAAEASPLLTRFSLGNALQAPESLRILVAEDNAINQRLIARMLEKRGHRVTVANNGREALDAIAKASFDLVLMDIQMPEMDGFEATVALREREKATNAHRPVVALTAHAMKGDEQRCLSAGMDGYLSKPIRAEELDNILEKYARRSRQEHSVEEKVRS
jgi:two-component system, sensor histidine kinase and response regulator